MFEEKFKRVAGTVGLADQISKLARQAIQNDLAIDADKLRAVKTAVGIREGA